MSSAESAMARAERSLCSNKKELFQLLLEERARRLQRIPRIRRDTANDVWVAPVSYAQERLWTVDKIEGGSAGYQVPIAVRLDGQLDVVALRKALDTLISRHEILRTVFREVDGAPMQQIASVAHFSLQEIDLRREDSSEAEQAVRQHQIAEVNDLFNLTTGPLIRGRLLRLDEQSHVLLITLHHIIVDGWSKGVLLKELTQLYSAFRQRQSIPLEPLPIQYADYAQWQRQLWAGGRMQEREVAYWRGQLQEAKPRICFPARNRTAEQRSYQGERVPVTLSPELTGCLKGLAQQRGVTLFMTLCAGWMTLLHAQTGHADISIGSPIANRQRPELEDLIGLFVNPLVIRIVMHPQWRVSNLLREVRKVILEAYEHQEVPFESVARTLRPDTGLTRQPLFNTSLVFHNEPAGELRMPGLTVIPEEEVDEPAMLDLLLSLEERATGLVGSLYYATDLFCRQSMIQWTHKLEALLANMVDADDARIDTLVRNLHG